MPRVVVITGLSGGVNDETSVCALAGGKTGLNMGVVNPICSGTGGKATVNMLYP